MFRFLFFYLVVVSVLSCNSDDGFKFAEHLSDFVAIYPIAQDSVIACAAGRLGGDEVDIFFYPRPGVTQFYYFETDSINVDENNYENYNFFILDQEDVFNGYLKKFIRQSGNEKWVIVSFMENGIMNLSEDDDVLSGTYTFDSNFRYYDLDNVVLNITRQQPTDLVVDSTYNFTLMGVTEDNWVNTFLQKEFVVTP